MADMSKENHSKKNLNATVVVLLVIVLLVLGANTYMLYSAQSTMRALAKSDPDNTGINILKWGMSEVKVENVFPNHQAIAPYDLERLTGTPPYKQVLFRSVDESALGLDVFGQGFCDLSLFFKYEEDRLVAFSVKKTYAYTDEDAMADRLEALRSALALEYELVEKGERVDKWVGADNSTILAGVAVEEEKTFELFVSFYDNRILRV